MRKKHRRAKPDNVKIADPITFAEFYGKAHLRIEKLFCWAPSTIAHYLSTILNKLAPKLSHKAMCQLTYKDCEDALASLKAENNLRDETVDQYRSNLSSVFEYAVLNGVCRENVIKKENKTLDPLKKAIDGRQKRKSLNSKEEKEILIIIAKAYEESSFALGMAMQDFLGLRTAEVCGPNFRDVFDYDDDSGRCYLASYTQNRSSTRDDFNKYTPQKKTVNGYRYIPIPKPLQVLIEQRRSLLSEIGFSKDEIAAMPIVSQLYGNMKDKRKAAKKRCNPAKLSEYGGRKLYEVLKSRSFVEIPFDLEDKKSKPGEEISEHKIPLVESDTQAYILRRNYSTNLFGIAGLSPGEAEYVMGHNQSAPNRSPKDYADEDQLRRIQKKLDRLIFLTDDEARGKGELLEKLGAPDPRKSVQEIECQPGSCRHLAISDEVEKRFSFVPKPGEHVNITVTIEAEEPFDKLEIELQSEGETKYSVIAANATPKPASETANVLSFYYDSRFEKNASDQAEDAPEDAESRSGEPEEYVENIQLILDYEKNTDPATEMPEDTSESDDDDDDDDD